MKMGFHINNTAQTIPKWVLSDSSYKEALTGRFSKFSTAAIVNTTMWIYEGDSYVGSILASSNEMGVFYLEYRGERYKTVFVRGVDKEDTCLCVFDSMERLIGEIYRKPAENWRLDFFKVYAEQESWKELLILLTIHIDYMKFNKIEDASNRTGSGEICLERDRYFDLQFMQRIAEREHYDMNKMPTSEEQWSTVEVMKSPEVKQEMETGQKIRKTTNRIVLIVFLIVFAFMMIPSLIRLLGFFI